MNYMGERIFEQKQLDGLMSDNGYPYPSKAEMINIFASSCIEATARKLNVSAAEMYQRMKAVDLFEQFIFPCYEALHTQSREIVTEDVLEQYFHHRQTYCQRWQRQTGLWQGFLCD